MRPLLVPKSIVLLAAAAFVLTQATTAYAASEQAHGPKATMVSIDAPAPGHEQTWDMEVRNTTAAVMPLALEVKGDDAALFSGTNALELTVTTAGGAPVLESTPVEKVLGQTFALPDLPPGQTLELKGTVKLPRAADNSYQGLSGKLKFSFVTMANVGPTSPPANNNSEANPPLASTGASGLPVVLAGAGVFVLLGIALVLLRRKQASHDRA